jgi:MFS family permease
VASFLFGTTLAFGMPVFQAIVPDLVPRRELAPAVSLNSIGINVARVIGPAIGGALILISGTAAPFFVTGVFYVIVIGLLLSLPAGQRSKHDTGWSVPSSTVSGTPSARPKRVPR